MEHLQKRGTGRNYGVERQSTWHIWQGKENGAGERVAELQRGGQQNEGPRILAAGLPGATLDPDQPSRPSWILCMWM